MCFVTYFPYQQGFILTSNRDESTERPRALPPKKYFIDAIPVFYPQDSLAKGTWIAASPNTTLCLLNGAFEKHLHQPPYRLSRGLVVLDFFRHKNSAAFIDHYSLKGIEPFTLVVIEEEKALRLWEFRWDGVRLHVKNLDPQQNYAWSSVTLYSEAIVREREHWLQKWQAQHPVFNGADVLEFHSLGGNGDLTNDLVMNRNDLLRTVSITQIQKTPDHFFMNYWDKLNDRHFKYRIFEEDKISY